MFPEWLLFNFLLLYLIYNCRNKANKAIFMLLFCFIGLMGEIVNQERNSVQLIFRVSEFSSKNISLHGLGRSDIFTFCCQFLFVVSWLNSHWPWYDPFQSFCLNLVNHCLSINIKIIELRKWFATFKNIILYLLTGNLINILVSSFKYTWWNSWLFSNIFLILLVRLKWILKLVMPSFKINIFTFSWKYKLLFVQLSKCSHFSSWLVTIMSQTGHLNLLTLGLLKKSFFVIIWFNDKNVSLYSLLQRLLACKIESF